MFRNCSVAFFPVGKAFHSKRTIIGRWSNFMNNPGTPCRNAHLAHKAIFFFDAINPSSLFTPRWLKISLVLLRSPNFSTVQQLLEVDEQASPIPMAFAVSEVFNAETLLTTIACLFVDASAGISLSVTCVSNSTSFFKT